MNNLSDKIFEFGFHDSEISAINCKDTSVYLHFNKGLYLLDSTGKETELSKPVVMKIDIDPRYIYDSLEDFIEIKEFNNQEQYIDFLSFQKSISDLSFGIHMVYYSRFSNIILFDGGNRDKHIMFTVENCIDVVYQYI